MKRISTRTRLGITLLETIVVMLIAIVAMRGLYAVIGTHVDEQTRMAAATQMKEVTAAAREYVQKNHGTLLSNPGIMGGITASGMTFMGQPLSDVRNIYQQGYEVRIKGFNNASGQRQLTAAVVTVGGETLSPSDGNAIARAVGGRAGFVSGGLLHGPIAELNVPMTDYGSVQNGRLFSAALLAQSGDYNSDGIFRKAVPGRPDLNTAQVDMDFAKNDVNNVLRTQATTVNVPDVSGAELPTSREVQIDEATIDRLNADLLESRTLSTQNLYVTLGPGGRSNNVPGAAQGTQTGTGNATIEGDTHVHGTPNGAMVEGINTRTGDIDTDGGNVFIHHVNASGTVEIANGGALNLPNEQVGDSCTHLGAIAVSRTENSTLVVCRDGRWSSNLRYYQYTDEELSNGRYIHTAYTLNFFKRIHIPGQWEACFISAFQMPTHAGGTDSQAATRVMVRTERQGCCGGGGPNDLVAETDTARVVDFLADIKHSGDSSCSVNRDASGNWYADLVQEGYVTDLTWCDVGCLK